MPIVAISADGTLGWLACQIEADGEWRRPERRTAEPIAFGFSWVELYARNEVPGKHRQRLEPPPLTRDASDGTLRPSRARIR